MREVRIEWDGPYSVKEALGFDDDDEDSGLYQIYGTHVVFGEGSLLYIGMAREQTFRGRMQQQDVEWMKDEEGVSIRLGRVHREDHEDDPPEWKDWGQVLGDAEALEIYWHSPPYNSKCIADYAGPALSVINQGRRGSLQEECSSEELTGRPKDDE